MKAILKAAWFTPGIGGRWGLPLLFRGAPGVGKTAILKQAAEAHGLHCEAVLASIREPSDFLGLPIPTASEEDAERVVAWMREASPSAEPVLRGRTLTFRTVSNAPPRWAVNLAVMPDAVGFFDEISSCPPSVQAALLRVILEGVVGDLQLPDTVRWVAAANPTDTAAGGHDLAAPLANRFGHLAWPTPTVEEWTGYMLSGGRVDDKLSAAAARESVALRWADHYPQAVGSVTSFLRAQPGLLHKQPDVADPKASEAWPSPRSWEHATRAVAGANLHGLSQSDRETLVAAFVGAGPMAEYATFAEKLDLPDPADLLDGKVEWKHAPRRLDRTAAVLSACTSLLVTNGPKHAAANARVDAFWKVLRAVVADCADIAHPAYIALTNAKFPVRGAPADYVMHKIYPVLDAAGRATGRGK